MFYTGLNHECAQCLCHATSTDELLEVWEKDEDNPIIPMSGFDRQLKFLREWGTDWKGADMKSVLSATIFAQGHTK